MKREILTDRLLLRPFRADDAEKMFHGWVTDPEVTRYLTWEPHKNLEETERILEAWLAEYEKKDCYRFGIERREDGRLMGSIDVVNYKDGIPEIGYCSGREFWGKGYMTEACRAFVELLFSEGYPQIRIRAVQQNIGSNRVIQSAIAKQAEKSRAELLHSDQGRICKGKTEFLKMNSSRLGAARRFCAGVFVGVLGGCLFIFFSARAYAICPAEGIFVLDAGHDHGGLRILREQAFFCSGMGMEMGIASRPFGDHGDIGWGRASNS